MGAPPARVPRVMLLHQIIPTQPHVVTNRRHRRACVPMLTVAIMLAGCGAKIVEPRANSTPPQIVFPTPPNFPAGPGIHLFGNATQVNAYATPASLCNSALVVEGALAAYGPGHWNSADGSRPSSFTTRDVIGHAYRIYTPMRFSQWHVLLDRRGQPTREYVVLGGTAGHDSFYMSPYPQPRIGQLGIMIFISGMHATTAPNQPLQNAPDIMVLYAVLPVNAQQVVTFPPTGLQVPVSQVQAQLAKCPAGS